MKNLTIIVLVFVLFSLGLVHPNFAQDTTGNLSKQDEKAAKQAEKVHKKVSKLGIGDNATITVTLLNDKTYSSHVGETNNKSFTVIDKGGTSTSVNYADVKALQGRHTSSGAKAALYIGIGAGAVLLTFLFIYLHDRGVPPGR